MNKLIFAVVARGRCCTLGSATAFAALKVVTTTQDLSR